MYTINVLVPFELMIDTDMGLIKLLEFDYNNDEYFYPGILNAGEEAQQYLLNTRKNKNPLSIACKKDDQELIDDLYNQFMEKEYDQILMLSCNTNLVDLANVLKISADQVIRLTVLCKDIREKKLLEHRKISLFRTLVCNYEAVDLSKYDTIYVKDAQDLDKFKKSIFRKNIYIANYGFNVTMDPERVMPLLPEETLYKYGGMNELYVVSVYQFDPNKIPLD